MAPPRAVRLLASCVALAACAASAAACPGSLLASGVSPFDVRRYAGDWYTQAVWGTGANSMLWCGRACVRTPQSVHVCPTSGRDSCGRARSTKTTYTAYPSPGVSLGVRTEFFTPYLNRLTLTGTKSAPNASRPAELLVTPTVMGGARLDPTPSWVVALAPDYSWSATAAGPPTEESSLGCVPRERTGGMAILTRAQHAPPETIRQAKAALALMVRRPSAFMSCSRVTRASCRCACHLRAAQLGGAGSACTHALCLPKPQGYDTAAMVPTRQTGFPCAR